MGTRDDFRNQVNAMWQQAMDQLEDIKDALIGARGRFEKDIARLRDERDRLLKRLRSDIDDLVSKGKAPEVVKKTVDRLNEVIERLIHVESKTSATPDTPTKKKTTRSAPSVGAKKTKTARKTSPRKKTSTGAKTGTGTKKKTTRKRTTRKKKKTAAPTEGT